MGLFSLFKKSAANTAAPATAPSPSAVAKEAPTPAAGPDIPALIEVARTGAPGAMQAVWRAIFALPRWHFVGRGQMPDVQPFCGVVEGRPMLCAFTSSDRALEFAKKQGLASGDGGYAILEMQVEAASAYAVKLGAKGVQAVVFDDSVGGGIYAALQNLVHMYSTLSGVPLAEAAERFELDPFDTLLERASQTGDSAHVRELIAWACRRPAWWLLADADDPSRPAAWTTAMDVRTAAAFTDPARAASAAQTMGFLDAHGQPRLLQLPPLRAAAAIAGLHAAEPIGEVTINLRLPLEGRSFDALVRTLAAD